ncbi:MAG: hypothetical protein GXO70_00265 [Acidobacteria bacterium]|nr:hypothetical protein [Acidobacteriota bacterium]
MDTRFSELLEHNPVASKRLFNLNQQILSEAVKQTVFSEFMECVLLILQKMFKNDEVIIVTGPGDKRTCYRLYMTNGRPEFSSLYNAPSVESIEDAEPLFRKVRHVHRPLSQKPLSHKVTHYSHFTPLWSGMEKIGSLVMATSFSPFSNDDCTLIDMIADTLSLAMASFEHQSALIERVKELTCLYRTAQLSADPNLSISEVFQEVIKLLPPAWQYPDVTAGKIVFDSNVFTTPNYISRPRPLQAEIVVSGQNRGWIEVVYLQNMPIMNEGPFLKEERNLINTIAHQLVVVIEHRELEKEQEQLYKQLLHADRLATIGKLAAGVAHELNEPLGNVLGFAQLLTKDTTLPETAINDITKIESAALHGREIVRKLMLFARQTQPQKAATHINKVVHQALSLLESRLSRDGIVLDLQLGENIPEMVLDSSQFIQVIINLAVNAIQAMPRGGELLIKTGCDADTLELMVVDTGTGMTEMIRQQVFLPFFTTKDIDKGTGLGLSVVHGIILAHNGTIDVESESGKGTTFTVRVPIIRNPDSERENHEW